MHSLSLSNWTILIIPFCSKGFMILGISDLSSSGLKLNLRCPATNTVFTPNATAFFRRHLMLGRLDMFAIRRYGWDFILFRKRDVTKGMIKIPAGTV